MKKVTIIGSTGSIGKSTLQVIHHLKQEFKVFALAAGTNYQLLAKQVQAFHPEIVVTIDEKIKDQLFHTLKPFARKLTILSGESGLNEIATARPVDILVMAMSGTQGIIPLLKAIKAKKRICLATKELLVSFGKIIMSEAKKYQTEILPIDSELVGLHQCLYARNPTEVKKVILTASGGPFFNVKNLSKITIDQALCHPIWKMGKKITVDSATLANKGLEVIETARLFSIPPEKIEVLIHPQGVIHSLVEFLDSAILAQLSIPDMRVCIQYALTFPYRQKSLVASLDLTAYQKLEFFKPNLNRFPALKIAYDAIKINGIAPCIFNTANEIAVNKFLAGKIKFNTIPTLIRKTLSAMPKVANPNLNDLLKYEKLAAQYTESII